MANEEAPAVAVTTPWSADEEGIWRPATLWRPDMKSDAEAHLAAAHAPGAPLPPPAIPATVPPGTTREEVTSVTLESRTRVYVTYNDRVIRQEVLNAGTKVGICIDVPTPPPPPPVPPPPVPPPPVPPPVPPPPVPPPPVPPPPLPPVPPPPPPLSRTFRIDAPRDGVTRADLIIQQQWAQYEPGRDDVFLFPAGDYLLVDSVKIHRGGKVRIVGEPGARIHHQGHTGFQVGNSGQPFEGIVIEGFTFVGLPGRYGRTHGNVGHAVQIYGPKGTVVRDCEFRGSGAAVYNAGVPGQTYGTVMERLTVRGWGGVAVFCNGGERLLNCQLLQDDPDERMENSSHGIYIHSGCDDVRVENVLIERARKYGIQLYGQDPNTTIANVTLRDLTLRSCANGLTLQQSAPDRARVKNLVVERLVTEDIYGGPALSIKQGDSAVFRDIRLGCRPGSQDSTGLQLGLYAPYENTGFNVNNMTFERPVITDCGRGIWAMLSFGGTFSNLRVLQPVFERCRSEVVLEEWQGVPVSGLTIER